MSRILLAIRCFFAVLFASRLPSEAARLLPASELLKDLQLRPDDEPAEAPAPAKPDARPAEPTPPVAVAPPVEAAPPVVEAAPAPPAAPPRPTPEEEHAAAAELRRRGAIQLLAILQREGRLVDFLMEDLAGYDDAQIGAAVRDIHRDCKRGLAEHVKVVSVRPEPDEAAVRIDEGYDPSRVRLIGNITGKPPFHGTLKHHGWAAKTITLPDPPASHDPLVINPAEVELGG